MLNRLHDKWRAYLNRRMLICVFLGFSSGLPLFILINLVQAWLRSTGVDLKTIGLFALIGFPYTWKFFWAPLMDRYVPRIGSWRPGRRRGWMLITQLLITATVAVLGFTSPQDALWTVAVLTAALAFFSASQDIALDAYRRELLDDREQGLGTAIHVNAYKIAGLVPGSLALILADHLPWSSVFLITAAFMLPGIVMTLVINEPAIQGAPSTLKQAIVLPFQEFTARNGWRSALLVLAFIFFYKLGDSMAVSLATAFYLDLGFTKTQIGLIAKNASLWASVAGGLLGGVWLMRLGIARGLWLFGFVQMVSTLSFAWLAQRSGPSPAELGSVIALEAFAVGLSTAAFTAYVASTTDPRYTATQFALFTSLAVIPRTFASAATGFIVDYTGWFNFFVICGLLAVPGILLLYYVAPWSADR